MSAELALRAKAVFMSAVFAFKASAEFTSDVFALAERAEFTSELFAFAESAVFTSAVFALPSNAVSAVASLPPIPATVWSTLSNLALTTLFCTGFSDVPDNSSSTVTEPPDSFALTSLIAETRLLLSVVVSSVRSPISYRISLMTLPCGGLTTSESIALLTLYLYTGDFLTKSAPM